MSITHSPVTIYFYLQKMLQTSAGSHNDGSMEESEFCRETLTTWSQVLQDCWGELKEDQSSGASADCFLLSSLKTSSCTVWSQELAIIYLLSCQSWWAEFSSGSGLSLGALGAILSPWSLCARFTLDEKQTATLHLLLCLCHTFLCKPRFTLSPLRPMSPLKPGNPSSPWKWKKNN